MNRSILQVPSEAEIQRAILDWLAWRGVFCWRNNQQGVPLHDGTGGYRPSPTRGIADILGVLPRGIFLAIEVKRPGAKPTTAQSEFLNRVLVEGGVALIASGIGEVEQALRAYLPPRGGDSHV
jgi:hypothetical protein